MSVLNQMLRDLDQRNGQHTTASSPLVDLPGRPRAGKPRRTRWLWPAVVIASVLLGAGGAWLATRLTGAELPSEQSVTVPVATPLVVNRAPQTELQPQLQSVKPLFVEPMEPMEPVAHDMEPAAREVKPDAKPAGERQATADVVFKQITPAKPDAAPGPIAPTQPAMPPAARQTAQSLPVTPVKQPSQPTAPQQAKPQQVEPQQAKPEQAPTAPPAETIATAAVAPEQPAAEEPSNGGQSRLQISQVDLSPAQVAGNAFARAQKALDSGERKAAERHLTQALNALPTHVPARRELAALYYGQHRQDEAIKLLKEGIGLLPQEPLFRLMLARLYGQSQQWQAALEPLKGLQPLPIDNRDYYDLQAALAQRLQDHALAKSSYQALLSVDATQGRWWLGLALACDGLGLQSQAAAAYRRALSSGQLSTASDDYANKRLVALGGAR